MPRSKPSATSHSEHQDIRFMLIPKKSPMESKIQVADLSDTVRNILHWIAQACSSAMHIPANEKVQSALRWTKHMSISIAYLPVKEKAQSVLRWIKQTYNSIMHFPAHIWSRIVSIAQATQQKLGAIFKTLVSLVFTTLKYIGISIAAIVAIAVLCRVSPWIWRKGLEWVARRRAMKAEAEHLRRWQEQSERQARRLAEERVAEGKRKAAEETKKAAERAKIQEEIGKKQRDIQKKCKEFDDWNDRCERELTTERRKTMTAIPKPPSWPCKSCDSKSPGQLFLGFCKCNVSEVFQNKNEQNGEVRLRTLKELATRWHPDKFAICPEVCRKKIETQAGELSKIFNALYDEEQSRTAAQS